MAVAGVVPMAAAICTPQLGVVVGGTYVLRELLGVGGMGYVFRADDVARGRSVALKLLQPRFQRDAWIVRRFRDEALAMSRLRHPRAVELIECELLGPVPFLAMEYIDGRPLGAILAERALAVPRALAIVDQLLDVLASVHGAGIVHADIKSDNLLVRQRGDRDDVTLIDFGLACLDGEWVESEFVSGTPEYMAPEVMCGAPPSIRADLYSVAAILYELLAGTTPFGGGSLLEVIERRFADSAIPPSRRRPGRDIPCALDAMIMRGLAREPAARFGSAEELREALRDVSMAPPSAWAARCAGDALCVQCGLLPARCCVGATNRCETAPLFMRVRHAPPVRRRRAACA